MHEAECSDTVIAATGYTPGLEPLAGPSLVLDELAPAVYSHVPAAFTVAATPPPGGLGRQRGQPLGQRWPPVIPRQGRLRPLPSPAATVTGENQNTKRVSPPGAG